MRNSKLSSAYDVAASSRAAPQVDVQDFLPVGKGYYKVVASVYGVDTESQFAEAVARVTDGAGRLIRGSTVRDGRVVVGVVASNRRSKPMDGSFTMVTACTASDASGNIWNVVNDGTGKRVVQESADDLEAILRERMAHRGVVVNPLEGRAVATASWDNGDVIRYVDVDSGAVQCALAFDVEGEVRGVDTSGKAVRIDRACIMASANGARLGKAFADIRAECAGTQLSPDELERAIAYLSKAGILSADMAERMRTLSQTLAPAAQSA